jgi:SAM-dependent methyltransferase
MDPHDITIETYQKNFDLYDKKTPSVTSGEYIELLEKYIASLPPQGTIFEIGSAQGRDAKYLRDRGFTVTCSDVIQDAINALRADGFTALYYDFRDEPEEILFSKFGAIYAKAVFLHATKEQFEASLESLKLLLRPHGKLCLTFKIGEGEEMETEKLNSPRFFKYYSIEELDELFSRHNVTVISKDTTVDKKWVQYILQNNT